MLRAPVTGQSMFAPIDSRAIFSRVVDQILALIRSGALKQGDQLPPETALAAQFGVSRPSVREALTALRLLGIIDSKSGVGSFVKQDNLSDAVFDMLDELATERSPWDVLEARKLLEPQVVYQAAVNRSDDDLGAMRRILNVMQEQLAQGITDTEAEAEFHCVLAQACGNRVLADCVRLVVGCMRERFWHTLRAESLAGERAGTYHTQHEALVAAIAEKDGERARQLMNEHLSAVEADLQVSK